MRFSKKYSVGKRYTASLLTVLAGSVATGSVSAIEFELGEVEGRFDSSISFGVSKRMEDRDPELISSGNGGTGFSNVGDDGDLNFDKGDVFSRTLKGVHDLSLRKDNVGAFVRVKWWNDFELKDGDRLHGHEPNDATGGRPLDDTDFHDLAQFSGGEILDAFVFAEMEVNEKPLDLRVGKQVVNWGESTFIQGGINVVNPVDVSAFRRPGAELKEGLLPVNMVYANFGATDNLTVEGFYQLDWEKTVLDGCGTFFSGGDFVPDGCDRITFAGAIPDADNYAAGTIVNRAADNEAEDSGQYGLGLRYYSEAMDAELGFYYTNYHSRLPYISVQKSSNGLPLLGGGAGIEYLIEYPEDISLVGVSIATSIGEWAVSGEISHRDGMPIQINGPEILAAALAGAPTTFLPNWNAAANGSVISGFDRYDVTQAQVTFVRFFERVAGASRLTVVGEVGATLVHDLPGIDEQRYGRAPVFGAGSLGVGPNPDDGYVTDSAWGYRLLAQLDYSNVFSGVSLAPRVFLRHDVSGYSPDPGQQFQEGRQSVGFGLKASYRDTYTANLSYTRFGDNGDFDIMRDRDFISLDFGVTF